MAIVEYNLPPQERKETSGQPRFPYDFNGNPCQENSDPFANERIVEHQLRESFQKIENLLWEERERKDSVPEQLANPIRLIGLVVPSLEDDPTSKDANLIGTLSSTLKSFTDPLGAMAFIQWYSEKVKGGDKEKAEYLLQSLLHTATFFDIESYLQLTNSNVIPLHTLTTVVFGQNTNSDALLRAQNLFLSQYKGLLIPLNDEGEPIMPEARALGEVLLTEVDRQVELGQITLKKGLRTTLNYIKMHQATNTKDFFSMLEERYGHEHPAIKQTRSHAIEYHHIHVTEQESRDIEQEGLEEIVTKTIIDAAEIPFNEILPKELKVLYCSFLTGSVAPAHEGHELVAEVVEAIQEERTKKNFGNVGLFTIVPVLSPEIIEEKTTKSAAQIGPLAQRIYLLAVTMRHCMNTYITTRMQQEFVDDPMKRITTIKQTFVQFVKKSLGVANLPFTIEFERVFGSDKILQRQSNNEFEVREPEPAYANIKSIVTPRFGHLVGLIEHLEELREKNPKATLILSPWLPRDSSRLAIQSEDFSPISSVGMRLTNGTWYPDQIQERTTNGLPNDKIKSVTDYGKEAKKLAEKEFISLNSG